MHDSSDMQLTHTLKQPTKRHHVCLLCVVMCPHLFFVVYLFFFWSRCPLSFLLSMIHFFLFPSVATPLLLSEPSVSSLERSSPLPEGRSRSIRSSRPFGSSSVTVVKMTPLSFLPGTRIIKYLGIINMFFIRETTSLREVRSQGYDLMFRDYHIYGGAHQLTWCCLSSPGRGGQWLSPFLHCRGVCNGPSSCSCPGG